MIDPGGFEPPSNDVFLDDGSFGTSGGFSMVPGFGAFIVIFVVVAIVGVAMALRRAKRLHDAGIDPLDPETDLQVRWARSRAAAPHAAPTPAPTPAPTLAERLAEVDRLHADGAITAAERDEARARILGSL